MDRTEGMKRNGKSNGRVSSVEHHQMQIQEDLHSPPPPYRHADSGEIKRDIRQTRSALDETIDALTERLQPRRVAHELLDRVFFKVESRSGELGQKASMKARQVASSAASNVGHTARVVGVRAGKGLGHSIKKNPLGFALIGAGIGYILFSGRKNRHELVELDDGRIVRRVDVVRRPVSVETLEYGEYGESYGPTYGSDAATGSVGSIPVGRPVQATIAGSARSSESGMGGDNRLKSASGKVSSTAHGIKRKASTLGHGVKSKASSVGSGIKSAGHGIKSAASSAGHGIKSAGHGIKSAASSAGHGVKVGISSVGSGLSSVGSSVSSGANQLAHNAREGYVWTMQRGRQQARETPFLMSLGALALGILVGTLLPNTRREHRALGPVRDSLLAGARDVGQQVAEQSRQVARKTADRAASEIYEQGINPDQLASELEDVASEIASSARESLERRDLGAKVKRAARNTAETAVSEASEIKHVVSNKLKRNRGGIGGGDGELPETRSYGSVQGGSTLGKQTQVSPRGTNLTSQATSSGPIGSRNIERNERSELGSSGVGTTQNPSAGNIPTRNVPSSGGNVARTPGGALPEQSPQRMNDVNRGSTSGIGGISSRPTPIETGGATGRNVGDGESTIAPSTGNKKRSEGPIRDKRDNQGKLD